MNFALVDGKVDMNKQCNCGRIPVTCRVFKKGRSSPIILTGPIDRLDRQQVAAETPQAEKDFRVIQMCNSVCA